MSLRFLFSGAVGLALPSLALASTTPPPKPAAAPSLHISGQDAYGKSVEVNGKGHYTLVMYTNPDLEDTSRKVSVALDRYRDRSNFSFVRVVDLRGGVPPGMRGIVRVHIREEEAKETKRLKKAGVSTAHDKSAIIPDFNGDTLDALGWDSVYDTVHVVVYDPKGHEIKRLTDVSDPKAVTKVVADIL